jgi:hypothetical protein
MCTELFIASDRPLPIVCWQHEEPSFHMREIDEVDHWVKPHLSKPFAYSVGSHLGCACGFMYGFRDIKSEEEQQDESDAIQSVRRLSEYLNRVVQDGAVEVLTFDGANWDDEATERKLISPSYFGGETFNIEDLNIFIVEPERDDSQGS